MSFPVSFGGKRAGYQVASDFQVEEETDSENEQQKEEQPSEKIPTNDHSDEEDGDEDNDADDVSIPLKYEATMKHHYKTVCAIDIDPAGSRMISGGYEFGIKFWDFNSMDDTFKYFRTVDPWTETYLIRDAKFSMTGDRILVISGSSSAKLLDRDGKEIIEFNKGDPYVTDKKHTAGHTHSISSCDWHPIDPNLFLTSGIDCTIREWSTVEHKKNKQNIVFKSKKANTKAYVTSCRYSPDGKLLAGACLDGTIRIFDSKGPYVYPKFECTTAHTPGTETSCIQFSNSGTLFASRGGDNTMKLFDMRSFNKPLYTFENLNSGYSEASCIFSPDDNYLLTGTTIHNAYTEEAGKVVVYDCKTGDFIQQTSIAHASVCKVYWHKRLNQIFAGCSDGSIKGFYDPKISFNGVMQCVKRHFQSKTESFINAHKPIYVPYALPMFMDDKCKSLKRQREYDRNNPVLTKRPELPIKGIGKNGRVGETLTHHIMMNINKNTIRDEDPREAILKYAEYAKENPQYVAPAYQKTQPKALYQEGQYEEYESKRRGQLATAEKKPKPPAEASESK